MIYCFDIDGTICTKVPKADYMTAQPFPKRINYINNLYNSGHYIKLFTARGSTTGIDWRVDTMNQLQRWGISYHELILGKPEADIYVDDRGVHSDSFKWE